jgi:hypothetical protein
MERLRELASFETVPGTLNVRLPRPVDRGSSWRYVGAAEISPDCEARSGAGGLFPSFRRRCRAASRLAFQADEPGTVDTPRTKSRSSARFTFAVRSASPTGTRLLSV